MINTPSLKGRPAEILLVEDNHSDALLTKKAFSTISTPHNFTVAKNSTEALAILYKRDGHTDAKQPDIILLDLNLPDGSGQDILRSVKSDEDLRRIPVIVLTNSTANTDIEISHNLYANSYVVKTADPRYMADVAYKIEQFWFKAAVLQNN